MRRASEDPDKRGAAADAAEWLESHLQRKGGRAESQSVKEAARDARISGYALRRAREILKTEIERDHSFENPKTFWLLPARVAPVPFVSIR